MPTAISQITGDDVGDVSLLMQEITARSEANTWEVAKSEWGLDSIEYADEYGDEHCLCGHNILEMCWLKNRLKGNPRWSATYASSGSWESDPTLCSMDCAGSCRTMPTR